MILPVRTYILVADGARARLFLRNGLHPALELLQETDDPAAHMRARELVSDRPGRTFPVGSGGNSTGPKEDAQDREKEAFARRLTKDLDAACERGRFERLVLIAPPTTLGELRAHLGAAARKLVTAEIGKDLTQAPVPELLTYLDKATP